MTADKDKINRSNNAYFDTQSTTIERAIAILLYADQEIAQHSYRELPYRRCKMTSFPHILENSCEICHGTVGQTRSPVHGERLSAVFLEAINLLPPNSYQMTSRMYLRFCLDGALLFYQMGIQLHFTVAFAIAGRGRFREGRNGRRAFATLKKPGAEHAFTRNPGLGLAFISLSSAETM